jgi:hypothetical protein
MPTGLEREMQALLIMPLQNGNSQAAKGSEKIPVRKRAYGTYVVCVILRSKTDVPSGTKKGQTTKRPKERENGQHKVKNCYRNKQQWKQRRERASTNATRTALEHKQQWKQRRARASTNATRTALEHRR